MEAARLTTVLDAINAPLTRTLRESAEAGKGFALAMVASLATVSAAAVRVGLVMDDALDTIRIRTGQTSNALDGLGESFRAVFRAGPDGAQQVADSLSTLRSRTGQTGDSLEALTTQILTLSRITKTDLNSNVADSARLFTSWGIAASEQGNTLDLLFRTYQQTGVSIDALLGKMVTAGPTFRAAGFDFATSAALLGGFEQAGVSAERVISGMGRAFNFFSKEGINASTGIRETIARIQELGPTAEAAALGVKVFGRGAVDMVAAIQSGRLNVDALVASIASGTDTIAAAARATDGFTENLQILGKRAFLALEPFGTAILQTFNRGLLAVLEPSRGLTDALHQMGQAAVLVAATMAGRMVPALALATRGYAASTVAAIANTVAMLRNATAAGVLSGAAGVLRGALAFFGGPWGLAITAALAAVGVGFLNAGRRARQAAADARQAANDFRSALAEMDATTRRAQEAATSRQAASTAEALQAATQNLERLRRLNIPEVTTRRQFTPGGDVEINVLTRHGQAIARSRAEITRLTTEATRARTAWLDVGEAINRASPLSALPDAGGGGPGPLDFEGTGATGEAVAQTFGRSLRTELGKAITRVQEGLDAIKLRPAAFSAVTAAVTTFANGLREGVDSAADRLRQGMEEAVSSFQSRMSKIKGLALAYDERGRALGDSFAAALSGALRSIPQLNSAASGWNAARTGGAGVAGSAVAGAGLAAAMELLAGVAETLGPALAGLLYPVRLVGEMFGTLLAPVARLLFQPLRLLAIGFTYLQTALGWLIRGIGKLIDAIPGISGGPLIRAGQSIMDGAEGVRRRLEDLDFTEAVDAATRSAERLAESLSNVPPLFDLALRRMQAGRATAGVGTPAPSPAPPLPPTGGAGGGQPVHVHVHNTYHIDGRGAASDRELLRVIDEHQARKLRGGDSDLRNAVRAAVLG